MVMVMVGVVTCKYRVVEEMVMVGVVTCKHKVVVEMVMEEVETCKDREVEVMAMAVGVIYIHKEEVAMEEISMAEEVTCTNMVYRHVHRARHVCHGLAPIVVLSVGGMVVVVRNKYKAHWPPL